MRQTQKDDGKERKGEIERRLSVDGWLSDNEISPRLPCVFVIDREWSRSTIKSRKILALWGWARSRSNLICKQSTPWNDPTRKREIGGVEVARRIPERDETSEDNDESFGGAARSCVKKRGRGRG